MSDTGNAELEKRLAALEKGEIARVHPSLRRSPLLALIVVALVSAQVVPFSIMSPDQMKRNASANGHAGRVPKRG